MIQVRFATFKFEVEGIALFQAVAEWSEDRPRERETLGVTGDHVVIFRTNRERERERESEREREREREREQRETRARERGGRRRERDRERTKERTEKIGQKERHEGRSVRSQFKLHDVASSISQSHVLTNRYCN